MKGMATDPMDILNRRNAEVAKIRGYADLTDEAKNRKIEEVTQKANAEYQEANEASSIEGLLGRALMARAFSSEAEAAG
jgi:hypothetical protein